MYDVELPIQHSHTSLYTFRDGHSMTSTSFLGLISSTAPAETLQTGQSACLRRILEGLALGRWVGQTCGRSRSSGSARKSLSAKRTLSPNPSHCDQQEVSWRRWRMVSRKVCPGRPSAEYYRYDRTGSGQFSSTSA